MRIYLLLVKGELHFQRKNWIFIENVLSSTAMVKNTNLTYLD